MKTNKRTIFYFLFPAFALLIVFKLYPIFYSISGSLYRIVGSKPKEFVGFANYESLFLDPEFWNSTFVTLRFVIITVPLQIILAIGVTLLMNQKIKGISIFRSIVFLPIAMAIPVTVIIWKLMLDPNTGLFNSFMRFIGGTAQPFLGSPDQALYSIIAMCTWNGVSYWAMFLLAGMQQISPSLYEAAYIDGATKIQQFIKITLPLMKRSIAFVTIANTVANTLLFAPMYLLTKGGPQGSTKVLMLESYQSMFVASNLGRSYSIITLLVIFLLIVVSIQSRLMKSDLDY